MAALAGGCVVLLAACRSGGGSPSPSVTWTESSLATPAGTRAVVRDASYCGGRWYVVGATATPSGQTRPAVWWSRDAARWRSLRLDPGGDYYAARAVLRSVGCSRGRIAVIGAKSGGAHGNPRTESWRQRPDGSLVAVRASFALYGGVTAVQVTRLEGGPQGYLIAGVRASGAAVWRSSDARTFRIEEGAPGLASTARASTQGFGGAWHGRTWWVVGTVTDEAGYESAMSWTPAAGGTWTRHPLPGDSSPTTAEWDAETPRGLLAVGLADHEFGAWRLADGSWSTPTLFGRQDPSAVEASYVSGLAVAGDDVAVSYSDGVHFRVSTAVDGGSWTDLAVPVSVSVSGDHQLAVSGGNGRLLLLGDDGTRSRVWVAAAPT